MKLHKYIESLQHASVIQKRDSEILFMILISFVIINWIDIPLQFIFAEVLIDVRIIFLTLLAFLIVLPNQHQISKLLIGKFSWNYKENIHWFLFTFLASFFVIGIGFLFQQYKLGEVDNWETKILGVFLDIPIVALFSITTIFFEEIFFRLFLFSNYSGRGKYRKIFFPLLLWGLYSLSSIEISNLDDVSLLSFFSYKISEGLLLFTIFKKHQSIWPLYMFRIGIYSLPKYLISSKIEGIEGFFNPQSIVFDYYGYIYTIIFVGAAIFVNKMVKNTSIVRPV